MKSSNSALRTEKCGPEATLLRHATTPKLVETAHCVLFKIFFTDRLPRENTHGVVKKFWQGTEWECFATFRVARLPLPHRYARYF